MSRELCLVIILFSVLSVCSSFASHLDKEEQAGCFSFLVVFFLLSGPPGLTCWISFAPVFSFMYSTFESLS